MLFLAREFPAARVRGVDPSEASIRAAVARIGLDPEGRVAFKRGSRRSLPYPDDLFDLVAQRHGALHAREAARVLRPGGHLIHIERPAGGSLARARLPWLRRRLDGSASRRCGAARRTASPSGWGASAATERRE